MIHNDRRTTTSQISNLTVLFLFAAPLIVVFYAIYMFNPAHMANPAAYLLHIGADTIGIFVILSLWLTILLDLVVPYHHRKQLVHDGSQFLKKNNPTIDIFITTAGEDPNTVYKTIKAAVNMDYPHGVFVLDDGKSEKIKEIAEELGAKYITRESNKFAKAGNINNGLKYSKADFFTIFDADFVPKKNFITTLLPYMVNEKLSMVQSPQDYSNRDNFIARGSSESQDVFYKFTCPAKNVSDSAFCVGTNMIFRRKAIDEIGGIAEINHSEDIWTSYLLHSKGWSTLFVNEVLATGQAPEDIVGYLKQQLRWAKGGFSMLFERNPLASKDLSLDQRLQYFTSNMFFFVGFANVVYLFLPVIYLLFGVKSIETNSQWLLHYLPYIALYYGLNIMLAGKLHIATISVSISTFYAHMLAFFQVLLGTESAWVATNAKKSKVDPKMKWLWPHVLLIFLTIFSVVVAWYEPQDFWATVVNSIWAFWNMYLLIRFITSDMNFAIELGKNPAHKTVRKEVSYSINEPATI